jgi:hypothetical protein
MYAYIRTWSPHDLVRNIGIFLCPCGNWIVFPPNSEVPYSEQALASLSPDISIYPGIKEQMCSNNGARPRRGSGEDEENPRKGEVNRAYHKILCPRTHKLSNAKPMQVMTNLPSTHLVRPFYSSAPAAGAWSICGFDWFCKWVSHSRAMQSIKPPARARGISSLYFPSY